MPYVSAEPSSQPVSAAAEITRTGASVVEAYAIDPTVGIERSAANLFAGTVSMFASASFTEVARPKPHRALMQVRPQSEAVRRNAYWRM